MQTDPKKMAKLIKDVLSSPHSEQMMRQEMIRVASQNLHLSEVVEALVEALPSVPDSQTRERLTDFLSGLDTSRFENVEKFHASLTDFFAKEKTRDVRTKILYRLSESIHQDPRLISFFIDVLSQPVLSDDERAVALKAVSSLPSVTEEIVVQALGKAVRAPTYIQSVVLNLADAFPSWNEKIVAALQPYLDPKVDRDLRFRIFKRLQESKTLTPSYFPLVAQVLNHDPDTTSRLEALRVIEKIKPWDVTIIGQLIFTSFQDSQESVRKEALRLQGESQNLGKDILIQLAERLSAESFSGARVGILDVIKTSIRLPEVRKAVASSFARNPSVFDEREFDSLCELLAPYISREDEIKNIFLQSLPKLTMTSQRKKIYDLLLPKLKGEDWGKYVVPAFSLETDTSIRASLFGNLKALSIAKYPDLVNVYCAELKEPASEFRNECAGILSKSSEEYPQIQEALEDVLLNDQERELVRLCLDGYLKPKIHKKFDVLVTVISNEKLDMTSRQRALSEILQLTLTDDQQSRLTEVMATPKFQELQKK